MDSSNAAEGTSRPRSRKTRKAGVEGSFRGARAGKKPRAPTSHRDASSASISRYADARLAFVRGFATSGGVVVPSFERAARTGHKVSGAGGGVFGRVAFFRRFFATAAMKTVMAITKSDVDGSSAHNVSSDAQERS